MDDLLTIIIYSYISGVTILLGGLLAKFFEENFKEGIIKQEIIHLFIAFGGGIMIAAVVFVLVPKGMSTLNILPMSLMFLAGAIIFYYIDKYIEEKGGNISQLLAMLMDFIPEALALGAVFATNHELGLLLAIFIALQNFPESFNSYLDLRNSGYSSKKSIVTLFLLSFTGVIAAVTGYYLLSDSPQVSASLMMFASGGILYLVFQDIAPMSKISKAYSPALGANVGFLVGMIGQKVLG